MTARRPATETFLTVSQVAKRVHLTVRTLHHYDGIGLLKPSGRSAGGYRLYGEEDLRRLRQILLFRELGFGLDAVAELVDASAQRQCEALVLRREAIEQDQLHAQAVLRAVDATLNSLKERIPMTTEHLFEDFDKFQNGEYARQAQERWGQTAAWQESRRRTQALSREDWQRLRDEQEALLAQVLDAMKAGHSPASAPAMALAERHRLDIDRRFYPCNHAMHCALADLYESDPRFRDFYEQRGAGLAAYLVDAIRANAAREDA